ncbi:MAG: hypothetical protein IT379_39945, partial [Deltaproteobacteria bacterium]|nr:hypothetical protein [Deltaproteobacteria bacterium]
GTAPWRIFVAEWYCNLSDTYDGTNYVRAKFQVVLYETWNLAEGRYGAREIGGSPANTGSASVGVKGDTSVTATNYRDLATPSGTPVDNLTLGGATSTSTTTLRHYAATEWPGDPTNGWAFVIEPAWPMTGLYIDISVDELAGVPDLWLYRKIANNVNWLYCNYRPPVASVSPWYPTSATIANPTHAVPVVLSADGLTYEVHVESYSADGTSTATVDVDAAADPQPATGGDWSSIATPTTPASSGTQSWAAFDITPNPARDFLRFRVSDADHKVMSIMVAPKKLTDFDPTASLASGFVWMSIAQIVQDGAAVHPEFFNRAWRNVARVVLDREQVLWSHSAGVGSDYDIGTSPAVRNLGVAPCALKGWQGQEVTVKILAQQDSNGGRLVVGQRGGESVIFDDIGDIDAEYHYDEDTMTLVGDEPVIYAQLDPADTAHVHYVGVHWTPGLVDEDYIRGTTPAPRLEYLFALVDRIRRACLYSYASTGLATMLRRGASSEWRCAWMVPPATKAMRAKVARHTTQASKGSPQDTSIYGASSGAAAEDEIVIPSPHSEGRDAYLPDSGSVVVVSGALRFDAAPAAAGDRLLESPTAGTVTGPTREMVKITYGVGVALVPLPDDPASA